MNVPYNNKQLLSANNQSGETVSADASPFVVAAMVAGIDTLPDLINPSKATLPASSLRPTTAEYQSTPSASAAAAAS
ncbi:hypothetical protein LAWI1_G002708 [Lachnellula willkommii]|uniref:Uncharacterized protein n=1 Tax=Lachnellula willkommii TaxID=215461 RepID=A0A559MAC4_9HELO|nr:hypothetical protein LAWI1_G002708 [Lachnellula willkommii]